VTGWTRAHPKDFLALSQRRDRGGSHSGDVHAVAGSIYLALKTKVSFAVRLTACDLVLHAQRSLRVADLQPKLARVFETLQTARLARETPYVSPHLMPNSTFPSRLLWVVFVSLEAMQWPAGAH
jgi:hypothetical protein